MSDADRSALLNAKEAAEYLKLSYYTLEKWRTRKQGLPYVKIGTRVFYRQSDLDNWLASNTHDPGDDDD